MFLPTWRYSSAPRKKRSKPDTHASHADARRKTSPRAKVKQRIEDSSQSSDQAASLGTRQKGRAKRKKTASVAALPKQPAASPWSTICVTDHETIHLFRTVMIPHVGPIRDVFGLAPIFTQDWLDMAQHDAFLYAASASIQSDLNLLRCQSSRGFNVSTKVLRYQTKALVAVRQDIESGNGQVRDETILAVLYLSLVNGQISFTPENQVHRSTLWKLVSSRGGIKALPPFTQKMLRRYEPFLLDTQYQPLSPQPKPSTPLFETYADTLRLRCELENLPFGFRVLYSEDKLPRQTLQVLLRLHAVTRTLSSTTTTNNKRYPSDNNPPHQNQTHAYTLQTTDFLDILNPNTSDNDNTDASFVKILTRTLVLYSTGVLSGIPLCTFISFRNYLKLIDMLRQFDESEVSKAETECLCWIWCVVISLWKVEEGCLPVRREELVVEFRRRFAEVMKEKGRLEKVVRRFFFYGELLRVLDR